MKEGLFGGSCATPQAFYGSMHEAFRGSVILLDLFFFFFFYRTGK